MNRQHLLIRIDQCMSLATASPCVRSHHGALIVDPVRNTLLVDGYNTPPPRSRGLCEGRWCARNGLEVEDLVLIHKKYNTTASLGVISDMGWYIVHKNGAREFPCDAMSVLGGPYETEKEAVEDQEKLSFQNPRIMYGHSEVGCSCAEMNALATAARRGVAVEGAWIIITGVPCLMCAKVIHSAGIAKVVAIANGYDNEEGVDYLNKYSVPLEILSENDVRAIGYQIRDMKKSVG